MRQIRHFLALISFLILIGMVNHIQAANFLVTNTNDSGAGSLRQAILDANAAATDDVINFDTGVFSTPQTITLAGTRIEILGNGTLLIAGPGVNLLTVSANDQSQVFELNAHDSTTDNNVVINDMKITKGGNTGASLQGAGIGINNDGQSNEIPVATNLTMSNVLIDDNSGFLGGGIGCEKGRSTPSRNPVINISNSTISNNTATNGAGAAIGSGAGRCVLNVNNVRFVKNIAGGRGGAIFCCGNSGTDLNIENSTFLENTANNEGSALYINVGAVEDGHVATIKNSTFAFNKSGAAIVANIGITVMDGVTIAYNTNDSPTRTGGLQIGGNISEVQARNTIIANNSNDNGGSDLDIVNDRIFRSQGYNLLENIGTSTITGDTTGNMIGVDPNLDCGARFWGGNTESIALRHGSVAIDGGDPTTFQPIDQRAITRPKDGDGNGSIVSDIGAFEKQANEVIPPNTLDFDCDGKTDVSIFRPATAEWWFLRSSDGGNNTFQFGQTTDNLVPTDFTGDGVSDVAFWRESTGEWFVLRSEDQSFFSFPFGSAGDIPAPGDFDGDGKADATVFRPSTGTWFINRSSDGNTDIIGFGTNGDKPIVADYDGDGRDDIAIFRPSVSQWWLNRSTDGVLVYQFGQAGDKTVQGDHTGDGKADVAFYRPGSGEWFVIRSENQSFYSFPFGNSTDIPSPGDYDGDGKQDAAVFRPATSTWFINGSTSGTQIVGFGASTDIPLPNVFSVE